MNFSKFIQKHEFLSLTLIEQYYGLLASKVAHILVEHGMITVKRAISDSMMKKSDFMKGLNVLIRCNLATITGKILEIHLDNVMNILLYPNYLMAINKRYGIEAVSLIKVLFLYGNMSFNELIEQTSIHMIRVVNGSKLSDEQIRILVKDNEVKLKLLMNENVIVPCKKSDYKFFKLFDEEEIYENIKKKINHNDDSGICDLRDNPSSRLKFNIDALNCLLFIHMFPYLINLNENAEADFMFKVLLDLAYVMKPFSMKPDESTILEYKSIYDRYRERNPDITLYELHEILKTYSHFFAPGFITVGRQDCSLHFQTFLSGLVDLIVKEFILRNYEECSVKLLAMILEHPQAFEYFLIEILKVEKSELSNSLYRLYQDGIINIHFYSQPSKAAPFCSGSLKKSYSADMVDVVDIILKKCYYSIFVLDNRRKIEMSKEQDLILRKHLSDLYKEENMKKDANEEDKTKLLTEIQTNLSEADDEKSRLLLDYNKKVEHIEYYLSSHVFILNLWKNNRSIDRVIEE